MTLTCKLTVPLSDSTSHMILAAIAFTLSHFVCQFTFDGGVGINEMCESFYYFLRFRNFMERDLHGHFTFGWL